MQHDYDYSIQAARPTMPNRTLVKLSTASTSAAPVNWAGRELVALADRVALPETVTVGEPLTAREAADEAWDDAAAAADDARLDADAIAEEAAPAADDARADAEAAIDDATLAADEARDTAVEDAAAPTVDCTDEALIWN